VSESDAQAQHCEPSTREPSTRELATALLATLRAEGAERWDAPGLAVVDDLLAQTEHAPAALAAHLSERAHAHAQELQHAFSQARQRGATALTRLRAADHPAELLVARALARGDTFLPRRLLRRAPHASPRLRDALRQNLTEQLDAQAVARGISSPGVIESPVAQSRSSARPLAMAQSLYRDAAAGASARMTLAKTSASVPQDAGHYHAVHVGARTLEEAARHPAYLKAMLARLETLAVLWHHGAVAPRASTASKSKKAEPKRRERSGKA
jgi:hypothetical protein